MPDAARDVGQDALFPEHLRMYHLPPGAILKNNKPIQVTVHHDNKFMMKKYIIGIASSIAMMMASCSTPKNITYFPELNTGSVIQAERQLEIRVKPEDKLSIVVSTQDPALSALFNLVTVQNRLNTTSSSNSGSAASSSGQVSLYTVDSFGDINFPVIIDVLPIPVPHAVKHRNRTADHMHPLLLQHSTQYGIPHRAFSALFFRVPQILSEYFTQGVPV